MSSRIKDLRFVFYKGKEASCPCAHWTCRVRKVIQIQHKALLPTQAKLACPKPPFAGGCGSFLNLRVGWNPLHDVTRDFPFSPVIRRVVRGSACPARFCTSSKATPCFSSSVMVVTRKECGERCSDSPAARMRRLSIRYMSFSVIPVCVSCFRIPESLPVTLGSPKRSGFEIIFDMSIGFRLNPPPL